MRSGNPEAYALATTCTIESARKNAYGPQGLKHPAVAALINRIRFNARELAWLRIEVKHAKLLELCLDNAMEKDATIKDKELALRAASQFASLVRMEDVEARAEQSRKAGDRARATAKDAELKDITPQDAGYLIDHLRDKLGTEAFRQLALGAGEAAGADAEAL
jgi:hypothetical protein